MSERKDMSGRATLKACVFPFCLATLVAGLILYFAPEVGAFAAMSAWIGIFVVLTIWGFIRA